ncbi:hypothetical protein B0H14DRAFT_2560408 [Mycena olivaceomarginata]|nr:hypothetical protein B0H14DRAFT_2560408 [Mycena olivaceomarginata]
MDLVELRFVSMVRLAAYIVRWYLVIVYTLHSSDTYLQVTGDTTHINYAARQSEYLSQIVDGLRFKTAWAEALLKYWNNVFFPDRIDSDDEESPGTVLPSARIATRHVLSSATREDLPAVLRLRPARQRLASIRNLHAARPHL